jgi:hypothetical protein
LRLDATHQDIKHRRERRAGCDFLQHSLLVGERVLRTLALSDVAEAPYTANISLLDQLNCQISLENPPVLQLQDIESFGRGRGNDFVDLRKIPTRVLQLPASVIPQLASMSRYHHVRRDSPKIEVFLIKFPDVIGLVCDDDGIRGGLERGLHHCKRRGQFIGALFTAYAPVRFFGPLGAQALCLRALPGRHNICGKAVIFHRVT